MKRLLSRITVLMVSLLACTGMLLTTAAAHSCLATELGGTYVQFSYSDGTLIKGAKIIVQDAAGETLGTDKTNSNGVYNYADYADTAAKVIMNDGEGHVFEYEVPDEIPPVTDQTPVEDDAAPAETEPAAAPAGGGMSAGTIAAVVVVVVAAVAIAVLFSKRGKKK